MDLSWDSSLANRMTDNYELNVVEEGNNATIVIRGIDNGIMADYYFEKRNGKWMLVYFEDRST